VNIHNSDLVTFMLGSLASVILRDSSRPTTRQFFCLLAKVTFTPPGVGLGGVEGMRVDRDGMGIEGSPDLSPCVKFGDKHSKSLPLILQLDPHLKGGNTNLVH